jgi:hypothetical protein
MNDYKLLRKALQKLPTKQLILKAHREEDDEKYMDYIFALR